MRHFVNHLGMTLLSNLGWNMLDMNNQVTNPIGSLKAGETGLGFIIIIGMTGMATEGTARIDIVMRAKIRMPTTKMAQKDLVRRGMSLIGISI